MAQIDLSQYKDLYLRTAREYHSMLQTGISQLAAGKTDPKIIEDLHIAAHSLKGQSLAMGYTSLGNISQALEHIFQDAKANSSFLTSGLLTLIAKAVSEMNSSLVLLEQNQAENDLSTVIQEIKKAYSNA